MSDMRLKVLGCGNKTVIVEIPNDVVMCLVEEDMPEPETLDQDGIGAHELVESNFYAGKTYLDLAYSLKHPIVFQRKAMFLVELLDTFLKQIEDLSLKSGTTYDFAEDLRSELYGFAQGMGCAAKKIKGKK